LAASAAFFAAAFSSGRGPLFAFSRSAAAASSRACAWSRWAFNSGTSKTTSSCPGSTRWPSYTLISATRPPTLDATRTS
jgi:hypothetical protein